MNEHAATERPSRASRRRAKVLLVDDDATQLKLNRLRLLDAGFEVETAEGPEEALVAVRRCVPDVILSDVLMGSMDGFGLCRRIFEELKPGELPVILVSAHYHSAEDRELAERVGASALVARSTDFSAELAALQVSLTGQRRASVDALDAAVYEQHLRTTANQLSRLAGQARSAEERYRLLFEHANDSITLLDVDGNIVDVNQRALELMGVTDAHQLVGRNIREFSPPGHEQLNQERYLRSVASGGGRVEAVPVMREDGRTLYLESSMTIVELEGKPFVFSISRDVTKETQAARSLAAAEEKYRSLIERLPDVVWTARNDGTLTFMTSNVLEVTGYTLDEVRADHHEGGKMHIHPHDRERVMEAFKAMRRHGTPFDLEYRRLHKNGKWTWVRNRSIAAYEKDGVHFVDGMLSDINERKQLEESFRQAQKMEAIGQLTGGIAHDFNNMLAAILGNCHFLLEELTEHDPRRADADEIRSAAERAVGLTRQLLAFSRRQMLEPTNADLNGLVAGLERMLRRLIGEDIELCVRLGKGLGTVRVDVGQFEQVIMNLVVNARDAMPSGGTVLIELENVELDTEAAAEHGCVPGRYVGLTVCDSGFGIDETIREHIFEPFFTTKEPGKGTGLGLSTCYGIVKQSGGFITVESEPPFGCMFTIYLPRVDALVEPSLVPARPVAAPGTETVLLIEDEDRLREVIRRILLARGYRVLLARDGAHGLEVAAAEGGPIHLVVSDVVMPGGSGFDAVQRIRATRPEVRSLFMSGYTDHPALRDAAQRTSVNFIQKPFAPEALVRKVREVLDA